MELENKPAAEEDDDDSFASDFYRSGIDWSCLNDDSTPKRQKTTLKQSNLFQCWKLPSTNNPNIEKSNLFQSQIIKKNETRVCPFYKWINGTSFTVDAFRYGRVEGCLGYFLTHFHADHYGGLCKKWCYGTIYCTPITATLVKMCLYVDPMFICTLDIGNEYSIQGIKVTMLEANHCPGAALIHFRLPDGQCHLHTGDFRASKKMQTYSTLLKYKVNHLYLDTTYCDSKYRFPAKEDVLDFVVRIVKTHVNIHPKTLIVVGVYSIGKECVYLAICKALGFKIHANASRRRILNSFGWPELSDNICTNGKETPLHVLPISSLKFEVLEEYLQSYGSQYSMVLAFRPTGWTYSETTGSQLGLIKPKVKGKVTLYGVPYSEHSSFTELQEFVQVIVGQAVVQRCNVTVSFETKDSPFFPPTVNDDILHRLFQKVASDMIPVTRIEYISRPPYFTINEDALPYGAALHASLACNNHLSCVSGPVQVYEINHINEPKIR